MEYGPEMDGMMYGQEMDGMMDGMMDGEEMEYYDEMGEGQQYEGDE
jgi:hypothetical protein